jgi:hypothetical protein
MPVFSRATARSRSGLLHLWTSDKEQQVHTPNEATLEAHWRRAIEKVRRPLPAAPHRLHQQNGPAHRHHQDGCRSRCEWRNRVQDRAYRAVIGIGAGTVDVGHLDKGQNGKQGKAKHGNEHKCPWPRMNAFLLLHSNQPVVSVN